MYTQRSKIKKNKQTQHIANTGTQLEEVDTFVFDVHLRIEFHCSLSLSFSPSFSFGIFPISRSQTTIFLISVWLARSKPERWIGICTRCTRNYTNMEFTLQIHTIYMYSDRLPFLCA